MDPRDPLSSSPAGPARLATLAEAALRLRGVHRAMAELRRGTPVLLTGPARDGRAQDLVVLPAETAGAGGLAELAALAGAPVLLLLAPLRAASVLRRPVESALPAVALRTPASLLDPAVLRGLADPTAEQLVSEPPDPAPAPALAAPALLLAKLARLLPAMLAAPVRPDAAAVAMRRQLLQVGADDVLAAPGADAAELVRVAEAQVPLAGVGAARVVAFRAPDAGVEHLAVLVGRPEEREAPLVRLHSECFTGDLLGSMRCDCGPQLHGALRRMGEEGAGVLLYLAQEGRGIGLVNKLRAYALQDGVHGEAGLDTLDANRALGWGADERNFLVAATMLTELGIGRIRLLTNNPEKVAALASHGIGIVSREPLRIAPNGVNDRYLAAKAQRFGHLLD